MGRTWGALAVLLGLALVAPAAPAVSAEPSELSGFEYVSIGDSYSAGFGLLPFSATQPFAPVPPATANGCYQAEQNYPHRVADALDLVLDDQTCSGAISANLGYPTGMTIAAPPVVNTLPTLPIASELQHTMTGQTALQLQTAALSPSTDIVTFAIGGNDLGFADIAEGCIRLTNGSGSEVTGLYILDGISVEHCKDYFDDSATYPDADLRTRMSAFIAPRIDAVVEQIRAAAPNAQIFVVGYPQVATSDAGSADSCFATPLPPATNVVPFSGTDILFIDEIEGLLNEALRASAEAHHAHFVDLQPSTTGHALCDPDPWINGLTIDLPDGNGDCPADWQPLGYDGHVYVCAELGALHPNAAGIENLAQVVTPAILDAFGSSVSASSAVQGGTVTVSGRGFGPSEEVEIVLHSTPVTLATVTADASGAVTTTVTIPASVPAGAHTLVLTGQSSARAFSSAITIGLAASGVDPALPLLAGAVLIGGGILLVTSARLGRRPRAAGTAGATDERDVSR